MALRTSANTQFADAQEKLQRRIAGLLEDKSRVEAQLQESARRGAASPTPPAPAKPLPSGPPHPASAAPPWIQEELRGCPAVPVGTPGLSLERGHEKSLNLGNVGFGGFFCLTS